MTWIWAKRIVKEGDLEKGSHYYSLNCYMTLKNGTLHKLIFIIFHFFIAYSYSHMVDQLNFEADVVNRLHGTMIS
jgi:hypothetical protein